MPPAPWIRHCPLRRLSERRDKRHNPDMYSGTSYTYTWEDEEEETMTVYVTVSTLQESHRSWCHEEERTTSFAGGWSSWKTVIPPWLQWNVSTSIIYDRLKTEGPVEDAAWAKSSCRMKNGLLVARAEVPNKLEKIPITVINSTNKPVHLCRETDITDLDEVQLLRVMEQEKPEEDTAKVIGDLMKRVDKGVPEKREELKNILRRHSKVFSTGEWYFSWTNLVTHTVTPPILRTQSRSINQWGDMHPFIPNQSTNTRVTC